VTGVRRRYLRQPEDGFWRDGLGSNRLTTGVIKGLVKVVPVLPEDIRINFKLFRADAEEVGVVRRAVIQGHGLYQVTPVRPGWFPWQRISFL